MKCWGFLENGQGLVTVPRRALAGTGGHWSLNNLCVRSPTFLGEATEGFAVPGKLNLGEVPDDDEANTESCLGKRLAEMSMADRVFIKSRLSSPKAAKWYDMGLI